jgi:hypothetical protein
VEVHGVDRQPVPSSRLQRIVEPVPADPELRAPLAAVREAREVAGAGARIDAQADRPAGRAPAEPLDLADGVEVDVEARLEDDVEVALGNVRAGVADLVGPPAVGDRVADLAR